MEIAYQIEDKLYINLTNRCSNNCKFCIRNSKTGVGGYDLWLTKEPTVKEVIDNIGDASKYQEIIFCGYGEPLIRLEALVKISDYLKTNYPQIPIRINTNGLANLIHDKNVLPSLKGNIDTISISLNASNAETYRRICQPEFGLESFLGVVNFIEEAKKFISEVVVSVVDYPGVDISSCRKLAEKLEVKFKIRYYRE